MQGSTQGSDFFQLQRGEYVEVENRAVQGLVIGLVLGLVLALFFALFLALFLVLFGLLF